MHLYQVEAHDGKSWAFGIRVNANNLLPEFCALAKADRFTSQAEALRLRDLAARLCGGSLRVARVRVAAGGPGGTLSFVGAR
ncbi:MAG: hypothetical protein LW834_06430 [Cyanobium sp. 49614_E6]|jgi:hypothetical protein|nr:hypothetical protein [Cyanobium sp. 49614_E6]